MSAKFVTKGTSICAAIVVLSGCIGTIHGGGVVTCRRLKPEPHSQRLPPVSWTPEVRGHGRAAGPANRPARRSPQRT